MSKTKRPARPSSPTRRKAASTPRLVVVKQDVDGRDIGERSDAVLRPAMPGHDAAADLLRFAHGRQFATILADPPWQFTNKTGKVAPEHRRLSRYGTMKLDEIMALPVEQFAAPTAHLYLWCPNAMLA